MIDIYIFQVREEPGRYSFQIAQRGKVICHGKRYRTPNRTVQTIISGLKLCAENDDGARVIFDPPDETLVAETEVIHCDPVPDEDRPRFFAAFRTAGLPLTG